MVSVSGGLTWNFGEAINIQNLNINVIKVKCAFVFLENTFIAFIKFSKGCKL